MISISVAVIIVNYKTSSLTIDCLTSLWEERNTFSDFTVIVVDNNSLDESVKTIAKEIDQKGWKPWITLLPLPQNGGFAYGNNAAIHQLKKKEIFPDYFWLLNPDTIVHKGACEELINFIKKNPQVGMAGSQLEDPDGTPQVSAFRDHSVISEFLYGVRTDIFLNLLHKWKVSIPPNIDAPSRADWISGASLMIRKEVFEQIGLLDEAYFMYYEEVDFCLRARKSQWECWGVPKSRVVHLIGAASGFSDSRKSSPRRPPYWFKSRNRFFLKNYGKLYLLMADTAVIVGYALWKMRIFIFKKKNFNSTPHFLRDFFRHSIYCKNWNLQPPQSQADKLPKENS